MPTIVMRLGGGGSARFVAAQIPTPTPRVSGRRPKDTPAAKPKEQVDGTEWEEQADATRMEGADAVETAETPQPELEEADLETAEKKLSSSNSRIELIIDSLPHHPLIEPIPVTIESLGDTVFTASMVNADIAATGNSIGEALLLLKEHIEATFDELNRQSARLTTDQKTTLQMLHTFIQPQGKRSLWS